MFDLNEFFKELEVNVLPTFNEKKVTFHIRTNTNGRAWEKTQREFYVDDDDASMILGMLFRAAKNGYYDTMDKVFEFMNDDSSKSFFQTIKFEITDLS